MGKVPPTPNRIKPTVKQANKKCVADLLHAHTTIPLWLCVKVHTQKDYKQIWNLQKQQSFLTGVPAVGLRFASTLNSRMEQGITKQIWL